MKIEDKKELWRWAVSNKAFDLQFDLTNLRTTFEALVGQENILFTDKLVLINRQIKIVSLELENLRRLINDINYEPKE